MEVNLSNYSDEFLRFKLQELYRVHDSLVWLVGCTDREEYMALLGEHLISIFREKAKIIGNIISEYEKELTIRPNGK